MVALMNPVTSEVRYQGDNAETQYKCRATE